MNSIDYSDEYKYWDLTEPVSVTLKSSSASVIRQVAVARRVQSKSKETVFQGVSLIGGDSFFNIPNALLQPGDVIRVGDLITDEAGEKYNVQAVAQIRFGSQKLHFRCLVEEYL